MDLDTKLDFYVPHPNFDDGINSAICQSEINGGVHLNQLLIGSVLEVQTCNHLYRIEYEGDNEITISGHPTYCPDPIRVHLAGSTWGTPLIKTRFIGHDMLMEFIHPEFGVIRTSPVREIRERLDQQRPNPFFNNFLNTRTDSGN